MANKETNWLPGEPPASGGGNYFRLKDLKKLPKRTSDLRILEPFINGFEGWVNKKPIRAETAGGFPDGTVWDNNTDGSPGSPKPFWAARIWNVDKEAVQLFSFTQGSVYGLIKNLVENKRWGALSGYDVTVSSKGEGMETEYSLVPCPKEPLSEKARVEWQRVQDECIGVYALFNGGDPFAPFDEAKTSVDADIPF